MKKSIYISFIFCCILLTQCSISPQYSKKIELDGVWSYSNALEYKLNIDQLETTYDLVLSLNYGLDFSYQNLYVNILTQNPNGTVSEDLLSLNLTNGSGFFLGDCNSSTCTIDILLREKFKFKEKGEYLISIEQHGREENLQSIYSAKLQLFQAEK
ncbi:MAG: hypothetical protein P1U56_22790 [Saprospiraceae bacterium]|nr:hypothetical protein [Saprospiraceae bacterium]